MIVWVAAASASVGEGYAAYAAGDVEGAIAAWRSESPSGVVAYDLGTALLTAGRPAEALPHLVFASVARPRDASVFHNLSLARSQMSTSIGSDLPPPAPVTPAVARVVTSGELAGLGFFASLVALAAVVFRARTGPVVVAFALATAVAVVGAAAWVRADLRAHPVAVVVAAAPVRATPDPLARGERDLPEGSEVRVVRAWGPFTLVVDGRGREGWMAEDMLTRAW